MTTAPRKPVLMRAQDQPRWQRMLVGCAAVAAGIVLLIGGLVYLWEALHYLNQERLHLWSSNHTVEVSDPSRFMWSSHLGGTVFWLGGLALCGLGIREVVHRFRRTQRPSVSQDG